MQSVPLAVTAIDGAALERANISGVSGLTTQVPSLVIVPGTGGSRSIPTFAIRGQSQQELSILADPSVPIYFNDVVVERQQGVNQTLFDLQSVEVLKGPQGTLFGRNSTGGAVSVKANTPTKLFEGYVGASFGNYGRFNTTAMVNQPLADWAQLRVAGQTTDSDGYIEDVVLHSMVNHEHTKAARVSLALQPMDDLESLFTYSRFIENDGATGIFIRTLNPGSAAFSTNPLSGVLGYVGPKGAEEILAAQAARGIYKTASGADQYTRISTWDLSNTTTFEISDDVSIKNIVGTRRVTGGNYDDIDGMPIPVIQIARDYRFKQYSEELQLLGSTGTLDWIAGLYYFNETGGTDDYAVTLGSAKTSPGNALPQPHPLQFPGWTVTAPTGENTSRSVFAQGTQHLDALLDGLSLTVGARYTWDTRKARIRNRRGDNADPVHGPQFCRFSRDLDGDPNTPETPAAQVPIDDCDVSFEKKFSEPTYNISLDYQLSNEHLIYLAHRRGYRSGGFGARAATEAALSETFNAEIVTDFELGTKSDFELGGMFMRFNLAIFTSRYEDIQRLVTDTNFVPPQTVPANAGKATIDGGELELTILPTDNFRISGFFSYTDAGYDEFKDFSIDNPATPEREFVDRSDQPFARAPKKTYSATARYTVPVDGRFGEPALQLNYFHTDGYSTADNYAPQQHVDGYEVLNFRADWSKLLNSGWDLGFSINNLLDEEYELPIGDIYDPGIIGIVTRTPGEPRTYVMDIKYRFGV